MPNILTAKTSALDLLGILCNVLWLVLAGWWLALALLLSFAQFQMDATGALNVLRLTTSDGQTFEFRRE